MVSPRKKRHFSRATLKQSTVRGIYRQRLGKPHDDCKPQHAGAGGDGMRWQTSTRLPPHPPGAASPGSQVPVELEGEVEELDVLGAAGFSAGALVLAVSVFVSDFVSVFDSPALVSEEAAVLSPPSFLAGAELYRSEYQPPPLRMKPPPREIWRFASALPQSGQSLSGSSEILC